VGRRADLGAPSLRLPGAAIRMRSGLAVHLRGKIASAAERADRSNRAILPPCARTR